jgi:hypothetical protein
MFKVSDERTITIRSERGDVAVKESNTFRDLKTIG